MSQDKAHMEGKDALKIKPYRSTHLFPNMPPRGRQRCTQDKAHKACKKCKLVDGPKIIS
jgi:hypothetical protein